MKATNIEAICARGPWSTTDDDHPMLTGDEVRRVYVAICDGYNEPTIIAGIGGRSGRAADRALTILKRAGLIRFHRDLRTWGPHD